MTYLAIMVLGGLFGYAIRGISEGFNDPDDDQDSSDSEYL